ncbi:carbon starvation protein A [Treponema saccharophilum]|uniref:Carbon starvation protein CstA n=1 Tax=Treponema saccharophilum DSM 2985 TaxID=907348 RepID=H7EK25_9SPIR|nr:carbon starvation protein A [Treponema saccharophilum]EIC02112.1 carbon starvation protein CstA [Treponema saccharophilum DSM 2985]BDC96302.1 carbon starvation protein A [Treponema saccharophilum]
MTALLIIIAAVALLFCGYVFYGSYLAKQWGIDPSKKTPAHTRTDGVDYVPAKPAVLMGHHFSSIAGAGPINGPIQAAVFGWVPVFLWCVIGGIFFGGLQDFGSLFASIRNDGKSVGEIIKDSMGKTSKRLFIIFALLVLILVIASFVNVVAGTFFTGDAARGFVGNPTNNQTTAMISFLFIILAVVYGFVTNRCGVKTLPATIAGIIAIVAIVAVGLNCGLALSRNTWIVLIGAYIAVASLIPVWIMLQPRDYLSSFLLYAMMLIALVGIIVSAFTGSAEFTIPAVNSSKLGSMFPTLFITVACGACSGFHSLIASGTSSKQLDNEKNAKVIGYGSMLIESALGIISLIAVGMVYAKWTSGKFGSPSAAFGAGIATMFGSEGTPVYNTVSALLTLAVSVFALTSLDSATRLSRFMFSELFLLEGEATWRDASSPLRKFLANPFVGTTFMVVVGCILGGLKLGAIWALFGSANQLLAGIALLAVAAWLGNAGKNNKMFFIPMAFMLAATLTQLVVTVIKQVGIIAAGEFKAGDPAWGHWFQLLFAAAMAILAVFLVIEGVKTFSKQSKK